MQKKIFLFIICTFSLFLFLPLISASASVTEGFTPPAPIRMPLTLSNETAQSELRVDYSYFTNRDFQLNDLNLGYNYISPFLTGSRYILNLGFGVSYTKGESYDNVTNGFSLPINANLGYRISSNKLPDLTLFGGLYYEYSYLFIETKEGIELNIWQWGPVLGLYSEFTVNSGIKIIPFYYMKTGITTSNVFIESSEFHNKTTTVSHIFGFDMVINEFSIGTVLDLLNSENGRMFSVTIAQRF